MAALVKLVRGTAKIGLVGIAAAVFVVMATTALKAGGIPQFSGVVVVVAFVVFCVVTVRILVGKRHGKAPTSNNEPDPSDLLFRKDYKLRKHGSLTDYHPGEDKF